MKNYLNHNKELKTMKRLKIMMLVTVLMILSACGGKTIEMNHYKIDGIECYYTTFTEEQHNTILNICKINNLFVSGGCDFHGKNKPNVDIGIGFGNLQIPTSILDNWVDKVHLFI